MLKIETRDLEFDWMRRVAIAMAEAEKFAEKEKSLRKRIVLNWTLHAVINYRIAVHLSLDDQQKRWKQEVEHLYILFPRVGLKEEEVGAMSRKIVGLLVEKEIEKKRR